MPQLQTIAFKNILVLTDFSQVSEIALAYALALSHNYNSDLLIAHITPPVPIMSAAPEGMPLDSSEILRAAERDMASFLERVPVGSARYEAVVQRGELDWTVAEMVEDCDVDLVVTGTRARSGVAKLVLGSGAEKIFRIVSCPVLTVGPDVLIGAAQQKFQHLIYATDFSAGSHHAWQYAVSLAEHHEAQITMTHVLPPSTSPAVREPAATAAVEQLRAISRPVPGIIPPEYVIRLGDPAEEIVAVARQRKAGLIVMGVRRAASWTSEHLPWTTAHKVVSRAHCPVLTVRG
jgi:nucleotide-binding universal stress UspA family protein